MYRYIDINEELPWQLSKFGKATICRYKWSSDPLCWQEPTWDVSNSCTSLVSKSNALYLRRLRSKSSKITPFSTVNPSYLQLRNSTSILHQILNQWVFWVRKEVLWRFIIIACGLIEYLYFDFVDIHRGRRWTVKSKWVSIISIDLIFNWGKFV